MVTADRGAARNVVMIRVLVDFFEIRVAALASESRRRAAIACLRQLLGVGSGPHNGLEEQLKQLEIGVVGASLACAPAGVAILCYRQAGATRVAD